MDRRLALSVLLILLLIVLAGSFVLLTPEAVAQEAPDTKKFLCGDGQVQGCTLADYIANPNGFVYSSWRVTRSIINILLIVALLVISFTNITRVSIDTYTVKKSLPNLIIGVILANASFLIVRYLADITNVATYLFINLAQPAGVQWTFAQFLAQATGQLTQNTLFTLGHGFGFTALLVLIAVIVVVVLMLWLAFLLYFRLVAVYLLTILAPLAFVAYGIPGLEKYFKMWWQQMIKWMFMVPAMAAVFWLMIEIGRATGSQSVARLLIMFVLFFIACTIPSRFGGAVIDKASGAFRKYSGVGAAQKAMGDYANLKGQQALWSAPIAGRYMKWRELSRQALEEKIKNKQLAAEEKVRKGGVGRSLAQEKGVREGLESRIAAINESHERDFANSEMGKTIIKATLKADFEKLEHESAKKAVKMKAKFEFMEDDNNKEFLRKVFEQVNEADHQEGAINGTEKKLKGSLAQEELVLAKHSKRYLNLKEKRDEAVKRKDLATANTLNLKMRAMEKEYETIKKEPGHGFFAARTIQQAAEAIKQGAPEGKLIEAKLAQTRKATDAGVAAMIEEALKTQTIGEAIEEIKDIDSTTMKQMIKGEMIGVPVKHQLAFASHTQKLIGWAANKNDHRQTDALVELGDLHLQSKGPLAVEFKRGNRTVTETFDNRAALEQFIRTARDHEKNAILNQMAKENPYLFSSGASKSGHSN